MSEECIPDVTIYAYLIKKTKNKSLLLLSCSVAMRRTVYSADLLNGQLFEAPRAMGIYIQIE